MLVDFFLRLRAHDVPVSPTEFLTLLEALEARLAGCSVEDFYALARLALVKDERHYDRFDRAFAEYARGLEGLRLPTGEIPAEWLRAGLRRLLDPETRAALEALGWERLMDELAKRLAEQTEAHHGGSKWIGTGGTSPFGHGGVHPEGVRIGGASRERRAVKVWERREFRNLDDQLELGTRNFQLALRKLRTFAREGAPEELDLDGTIAATARQGGLLDLRLQPERHNAARLLLFLDAGGSMDDHVHLCETLFSAARAEFKHLEHFYFHNCVYESVWRDNRRRFDQRVPLGQVLNTYGHEYRLVLVGDATMSPYEISHPGGSVEHLNEEPGAAWLARLLEAYPRAVWLNPQPEHVWERIASIRLIDQAMRGRMFPLTPDGLERATACLRRGAAVQA